MTENSSNNRENETEREDYACLYCGVDVCYHLLSSEGVKRRQQGKSLKKMCVYTTDLAIYWLKPECFGKYIGKPNPFVY